MNVNFEVPEERLAEMFSRETRTAAAEILRQSLANGNLREVMKQTIHEMIEDQDVGEIVLNAIGSYGKKELLTAIKASDAMRETLRDIIYSSKDEIIEEAASRAAAEAYKRGVKQIVKNMLEAVQ